MKHLKTTAGLLLLVHAFHLASLQYSTDSPGRTIDKSWLRAKNAAEAQNTAVPEDEAVYKQGVDGVESSNYDSSGIPSGSMLLFSGEEDNVVKDTNNTSDELNVLKSTTTPTFENGTNKQLEPQNATAAYQINMTKPEEGESNSTVTPQNSTSIPEASNHTDVSTTPLNNTTQVPTTAPGGDTNSTESTDTTTTTAAAPEITPESMSSSTTTEFPSDTTELTTTTTTSTTEAPITSEKANKTDKGAGSGGNAERGLASDSPRSRRQGAWGAVLGTAVAVACVGLVAYVIMKKRYQKGFSHRKLVEEYPSDPVLRLDNYHLDLNHGGGSAYYNPALQGDNIQMSSLPGRR